MDKLRQKSKKDPPIKHVEKDKPNQFINDVKSIRENLKIREILRTVKMNRSMRIKAPRGSKIMQNKDFNDNEDFDEAQSSEEPNEELASATNPELIKNTDDIPIECMNETLNKNCVSNFAEVVGPDINDDLGVSDKAEESTESDKPTETKEVNVDDNSIVEIQINIDEAPSEIESNDVTESENNTTSTDISSDTSTNSQTNDAIDHSTLQIPTERSVKQIRERKLSLDQTMLNRRENFSQSELDLHSIGKSPLERKSSFFRKKMESFFKNTTEIFKKQSLGNKSQLARRGSMSVSLQSLNENTTCDESEGLQRDRMVQSSTASLRSSSTVGNSSQGELGGGQDQVDRDSLAGSQPVLSSSQPLDHKSSESVNSLNENFNVQESFLNSRAISMTGLDTATGTRRRKSSRANRVTWLASEGLTNYLRRIIQDERNSEIPGSHSYQDLSSIPENQLYGSETDSKGRRLSYQRAVSGEDPVLPTRVHQEPSYLWKKMPEYSEAELLNQLAEFSRSGIPTLKGFNLAELPDDVFAYLLWAENPENLEDLYDWKKVTPNEEARQAVIRELINTEADYIRHLVSIVEVFIAAAHALQDSGKLLDIDTEKLFSNAPDVLNASLYFWELTMYPMIADAVTKGQPFNTELMMPGFCRFSDLFQPYERFVNEQTRALDYLRSLNNNSDFMAYLTWCYGHKTYNRLQLADIMVKPMQRLTKYSLILLRIIAHTETEPERTSLIAMASFVKNYVLDLNRSIRQREELEKLDALSNQIDVYEIDFKDEDMDRYFRQFSSLNLKAPMVNCLPTHSRTLIHQGDLRFRDNLKEIEVRAFLLTDMLLICKKLSKGASHPYKLIRPKYMVDKMMHFPKCSSRGNVREIVGLIFVVVDDVGTAFQSFALTETAKDPNPHSTLKLWEQKLREAKLTYELGVWFAKNPSRDLSEVDMDSSSDYALSVASGGPRPSSDDVNIEREARERVAAMLHRSMGASTEYDISQVSMATDSFDASGAASGASGRTGLYSLRHPMQRNSTGGSSRNSRLSSFQQSTSAASHDEPQAGPSKTYKACSSVEHLVPPQNADDVSGASAGSSGRSLHSLRHPMHRNSTGGSSRNSRLSSFQQSTSAASHDEPQDGPCKNPYKAGSSVEHLIPPQNPDDAVTSITVNVVSESESETVVPEQSPTANMSANKLSTSHSANARITLRVKPQSVVMALIHSLPDLTIDPSPPRPAQSPSPQSASEKLYQSHQELLQRNRLSAAQHHQYLTPEHRGTSYPPPSPTRASLKRGLAFSYSFKNPPLSKMGHVNSQSQLQAEAGPSTSQKADIIAATPGPSTSSEKSEKKSKFVSSRNKGGRAQSPSRKNEKRE